MYEKKKIILSTGLVNGGVDDTLIANYNAVIGRGDSAIILTVSDKKTGEIITINNQGEEFHTVAYSNMPSQYIRNDILIENMIERKDYIFIRNVHLIDTHILINLVETVKNRCHLFLSGYSIDFFGFSFDCIETLKISGHITDYIDLKSICDNKSCNNVAVYNVIYKNGILIKSEEDLLGDVELKALCYECYHDSNLVDSK